jgi:hypothetical protein
MRQDPEVNARPNRFPLIPTCGSNHSRSVIGGPAQPVSISLRRNSDVNLMMQLAFGRQFSSFTKRYLIGLAALVAPATPNG